MLFQQLVNRMCSHCLFQACWQVVNGLLTTCYKVVELNRLVTSCSNNLLSPCNSTICQQVVSDNLVATFSTCWQACFCEHILLWDFYVCDSVICGFPCHLTSSRMRFVICLHWSIFTTDMCQEPAEEADLRLFSHVEGPVYISPLTDTLLSPLSEVYIWLPLPHRYF